MSVDAIAPIEHTVHTTNAWIRELMEELGWRDRQRTYHALRAVLHALRDRLTVAEAVDLGAQLPMLVRGLYYEGWRPDGKPDKMRREEFLDHIAAAFRDDPGVDPEVVAGAVFKILGRNVSAGEIGEVRHALPPGIRALWPESEGRHGS